MKDSQGGGGEAAGAAGPVRWGVLGASRIAVQKVIPAMRGAEGVEVVALASRNAGRAADVAASLGIPRSYGSYEELLDDPDVDAVYNPLPNHLHVPWSIRAAEAGKHVLCEKPIGLSAAEVDELIRVRDRTGVLIGEAFMVRYHPQWAEARRLVSTGRIGALRLVSSHFSYFKLDPENIRNQLEAGGGAVMDIGCYPIHLSRFLFGEEPERVMALVERDPVMGIDRLTSAILDFPSGRATFTCSTQLVPHQRLELFGTTGRIEVEIPFNTPADRPARLVLDDGSDVGGGGRQVLETPAADQYALQAKAFSGAVLRGTELPVPLEDGLLNMRAIEALFRSGESGAWERVG